MAYVLKFISNVKAKAKGLEAVVSPELDASDIAASEQCRVMEVQGKSGQCELTSKYNTSNTSTQSASLCVSYCHDASCMVV